MTIHITSKARKQEEREIEALYPYRPPPYPADPNKFGNGTKVVCGVVIPDSRPTVEQYSMCRGFVHPGATVRDYSHCRGTCKWERPSPPEQGGEEAAPDKPIICLSIPRRARLPVESYRVEGVSRVSGKEAKDQPASGNGSPLVTENPHPAAWKKLNEQIANGETYQYQTPAIMRATAALTPRQKMAKAITRAIASIPQSWGDHDKIKLPYGFYLQRKGFDEARLYHPKYKRGGRQASILIGLLGSSWGTVAPHKLRTALDDIETFIKRYKLDKPTPEPTEPASQPAKAA